MELLLTLLRWIGFTVLALFIVGVLMGLVFLIFVIIPEIYRCFKDDGEEIDNSDFHVWCNKLDQPCIKTTIRAHYLQEECQCCPVVLQQDLLDEELDEEFEE